LFVSGWPHNPKNKRFQFFQVTVSDSEINAETIPRALMPVSEVMGETRPEITRQSDIIQLITSIKSIHTLSSAHISLDNILILLQRLPRNIFKVLAD
jgi:hypothetical protein